MRKPQPQRPDHDPDPQARRRLALALLDHAPTDLTPEDVERNLLSINNAPEDILPHKSLARYALAQLALNAWDCYVYASGGETTGTWVCWIQPLADNRPERNGRVTLDDWRNHWQDYLLEARILAEPIIPTAQEAQDEDAADAAPAPEATR